MSAQIIPFVPRHTASRKPMLEKLAHEIIEQVTEPKRESLNDILDDLYGRPVKDCGEAMQQIADAMQDKPA